MSSSFTKIGNCRRLVSSILQYNIYKHTCRSNHSLHQHRHQLVSLVGAAATCSSDRWHGQPDISGSPGGRRHLHLPNPFKRHQDFRPIDRVPETHELVYSSPFSIYISYFYPTSVLMMSGSTIAALYFYGTSYDFSAGAGFQMFDDLLQVLLALPVMGCLTYLSWLVARRAPLRIYFRETDRTFEATFATLLPWKVTRLAFVAGDIQEDYQDLKEDEDNDKTLITGTVAAFRGKYALGKQRLSIVPHHFRYPHFYNVMLGYVKDPPDNQGEPMQ